MQLPRAFQNQSENEGIHIPCLLMYTSGIGDLATYPWLVLVLVYGVRALKVDHSMCRSSSWVWLWVTSIMSGLMLLDRIKMACCQCANTKKEQSTPAMILSAYAVVCLAFGLTTQVHFLVGCTSGSEAHHALYVFMWGWYAHGILVAVLGCEALGMALCYARDDRGYTAQV